MQGQDMQDHKWRDRQDKFQKIMSEILSCCFEVMNSLGSAFVESIYRKALVVALTDRNLEVNAERGFEVTFRGRQIGIFIPDLIVEKQIIVELKSWGLIYLVDSRALYPSSFKIWPIGGFKAPQIDDRKWDCIANTTQICDRRFSAAFNPV